MEEEQEEEEEEKEEEEEEVEVEEVAVLAITFKGMSPWAIPAARPHVLQAPHTSE